jgi:Xaa-Pro aminopeptidase
MIDRTPRTAAALRDDELQRRVDDLQRLMADHGFSALVCYGAHRDWVPADLWYLARWSCIDEEMSYVVVPSSGPTTLVTDAEWDVDRAKEEAFAGEVLFDRRPGPLLGKLVLDAAPSGGRVGVSGLDFMPAPAYLAMSDVLAGVELVDATWLTSLQRTVKSPAEIELLREAARISDLGMEAGIALVDTGVTEMEMVAAAESTIRAHGAELAFTTVAGSGPRTGLTTFLPADRMIEDGDLVVLDLGARVGGYHGDMCRAVVRGSPDATQRRLLEAARDAVAAGVAAMRPGVRIHEVHAAARMAVEEAGLGEHFWGHYMPHGIGAAQHETPLGLGDGEFELREGTVVCVEPGIAIPGVGGVVLEEMVAVQAEGAEVLTRCPLELWER